MESARERVGNNILIQKLGPDREIKIQYTISKTWIESGPDDYLFIDLPHAGWISDINMGELQSLAKLIEENARRLGFEVYDRTAAMAGVSRRGTNIGPANRAETPVKKVYLLKRFREQLPPEFIFSADGRAILAVPKELASDKNLLDEIRSRVLFIFKSTNVEPSSVGFRREMQATKDQLLGAIRAVALGAVEELRQTYVQVSEVFLETLHELGGGYSAAEASQERGNIFEGWNEVRWLISDIRELLIVSAATDNTDVIGSIAFLPIAVASRAIQAHDHLLFQEFAPFATFLYALAASKPPELNVRSFMTDRSWRYLKNLADYFIQPPYLDRAGGDHDYDELADFALFVFKVFQDLLKAAFDKRDFAAFQVMITEFMLLFERFTAEAVSLSVRSMELQLEMMQDDDAGRARLETKLRVQKKKENASRRVALGRDQVLFGLAAYVLDKLFQKPEDAAVRQLFTEIETRLPTDLERFTDIFESTRDFKVSDYWGWSQWDMVADGRPHFRDLHSKPNQLYCVRALQILASLQPEQVSRLNLQKLGYLASEGNPQALPATLQTIQSQPEKWERILSATELAQINTLLELLSRARRAQADAERDAVIAAEIDPDKLAKFKVSLLTAFEDNGRLRPVMRKLGIFRDFSYQRPRKGVPSWGFNQLDDKGAFIVQSQVSYGDWGEAYGRGLAQAEDEIAFGTMLEGAAVHEEVGRAESCNDN